MMDRFRIEQVITNLLTNAIKYAPGNPLHISIVAKLDRMNLTMRDEGPGIAQKDLARIFERFERAATPRQQKGLGLGLFIVQQIVEAHDGTVHAESEPGRGSTFIIEMPLNAGSSKQ
jgi:signal transduction histidine kinase